MVSCLSIFWRFSSDWRTRHGNVCSPWCNQSDSCPMSADESTETPGEWQPLLGPGEWQPFTTARWVTAPYLRPVSDSPLLQFGEWQPLTAVRWVTAPYCSWCSNAIAQLPTEIQTQKTFKRTLISYDTDKTMHIFREIAFFRPQNDT